MLSKRELQEFRSFLLSPYFNQSKIKLELFDYVRPYHPEFNHKKLDYVLIFNALRPDKSYIKKFVTDRMSDLTDLIDEFLAIQYAKRTPKEMQRLLRENLLAHGQHEVYLTKTEKALEKIAAKPRSTWQYNLKSWELSHTIFSHPQTLRYDEMKDKMLTANNYLDEAYAILKLRYALHQLSREQIFSTTEESIPLLKEVVTHFSSHKSPTIQLYILFLELYRKEKQDAYWRNAYSLLFQHIDDLSFEEKEVFITALINIGHKIAKEKHPTFFEKIFLLYQEGLTHKIWTLQGEIKSTVFRNIVTVAASTQRIDWAGKFIEQYHHYVPVNERLNTINYAKAYMYFYQGMYDEAIILLDTLPQRQMKDKIVCKSLMLRCLYELRCKDDTMSNLLESFLKTFSKLLRKSKLHEDTKEAYKNLIYFIDLLNREKHKPKAGRQPKEKVLAKLEKRPRLVAFHWVMTKIEELYSL